MIYNFTNYDVFKMHPPKQPEDGDIACILETKEVYVYHDSWEKPEAATGPTVSIADLNRQVYSQLEPIKITPKIRQDILSFNEDLNDRTFVLANFERHYLTIFTLVEKNSAFADDLIECVQNIGDIVGIDFNDDSSIEFWIKFDDGKECDCYLFFPYEGGRIICD